MLDYKLKTCVFGFFSLIAGFCCAETLCGRASSEQKISVIVDQKFSELDRRYGFRISNTSDQIVKVFVIGEGEISDQIQVIPENIVSAVESPKNWVGLQVHEEEGFYTKVVWTNIGDSDEELAGFKLILKSDGTLKTKGTYSDGRKTEVMDYGVARYRIIFSDGSCLNGKVKAIK